MYFSQTCVAINPRISHDCMISQHIMDFFFLMVLLLLIPIIKQENKQQNQPTKQNPSSSFPFFFMEF